MPDENVVKSTADAVKGIVEAVPIYEDALQPAARELGSALGTLGRTINVALAPLRLLVWGYDRIEAYLQQSLAKKLKDVPESRIITPDPAIAGPALEALRFTAHKEALRELYSSLLATAMDAATAGTAHPAFVEVIRQLTPDEARIMAYLADRESVAVVDVKATSWQDNGGFVWLRNFSHVADEAECECPEAVSVYIDNLCRLQLAEVREGYRYRVDSHYDPILAHPTIKRVSNVLRSVPDRRPYIKRKALFITAFGVQFCSACGVPVHDIRERIKESEGVDFLRDANVG